MSFLISVNLAFFPHLVIQLFVQVADILLVFSPLIAGDRDTSSSRQQVVDDGSVVVRLDALLVFRAQLLLLRNVLPCNMDSWTYIFNSSMHLIKHTVVSQISTNMLMLAYQFVL